jgi:hypothetical protein
MISHYCPPPVLTLLCSCSIPSTAVLDSRSVGRSPSIEAKPETSLPDAADAPGPVGLSDPQYVAQRRKMLDTVNRLRATG